jgi:hypothetical protein
LAKKALIPPVVLLVRAILGVGTPRWLQGVAARVLSAVLHVIPIVFDLMIVQVAHWWLVPGSCESGHVSLPSPLVTT